VSKKLVLVLLLFVAASWCADWNFTLPRPAKIGMASLASGSYTVKIQGNLAIITERTSGKSITAIVRVEKADKPFSATSLVGEDQGGVQVIKQILIGGSDSDLRFGG
jgi:hypothetical protein